MKLTTKVGTSNCATFGMGAYVGLEVVAEAWVVRPWLGIDESVDVWKGFVPYSGVDGQVGRGCD